MARQRTPTLPAAPDAVAKAHAVYTPFMLAFYDVLGARRVEPHRLALPD
jgi:hypothetical protein